MPGCSVYMQQENTLLVKLVTTDEVLPLRHKILWPKGPLENYSFDEDKVSLHYGLFLRDELISVVTIYREGDKARLRMFATDYEYQRQGFGTILIKAVITDLRKRGVKLIWCDVRKNVYTFYEKLEFKIKGEEYMKHGLPHFYMELTIS